MKNYFLILLIAASGCGSVKTSTAPDNGKQLLKDLETLSSDAYEGRKTGTKGSELARTYIISRLTEMGVKPFPGSGGYVKDFSFTPRNGKQPLTGKNIIAFIPGKSDNIIVVSAHYDHLGVVNNKIFNGADDNASGVSALLKFAGYFAKNKPANSMIIVAFDAEEMGLQGAHAFVKEPPVPLERIKINLNMDMVSHSEKGELYASGTFGNPQLKPFITSNDPNVKLLLGHDDPKTGHDDWTNQSDQGAFNKVGIPFIYFGVEDHKDYHKSTDKFDSVTKPFFVSASDVILGVIKNIDKAISVDKLSLKHKLIMN